MMIETFFTDLVDWYYIVTVTVLTEILKATIWKKKIAATTTAAAKKSLIKSIVVFVSLVFGYVYVVFIKGCSLRMEPSFGQCIQQTLLSFFIMVGLYDWIFQYFFKSFKTK